MNRSSLDNIKNRWRKHYFKLIFLIEIRP